MGVRSLQTICGRVVRRAFRMPAMQPESAGHIDGVQAAVGLKRLRDEFAGEFRHFVGFNHAVGIFGEAQLEQTAAKAVHAAFVGLHTQISGDNENVLGRADEPRHDTGG